MTVKEALAIKQTWTPIQARNDIERLLLTGERPADKVVGLAVKAFEKQIPKKIVADEYDWACCPNCNDTFKMFDSFKKRNKFCGNCGQALDWSDMHDEV